MLNCKLIKPDYLNQLNKRLACWQLPAPSMKFVMNYDYYYYYYYSCLIVMGPSTPEILKARSQARPVGHHTSPRRLRVKEPLRMSIGGPGIIGGSQEPIQNRIDAGAAGPDSYSGLCEL